jgi:hypothetical protein
MLAMVPKQTIPIMQWIEVTNVALLRLALYSLMKNSPSRVGDDFGGTNIATWHFVAQLAGFGQVGAIWHTSPRRGGMRAPFLTEIFSFPGKVR